MTDVGSLLSEVIEGNFNSLKDTIFTCEPARVVSYFPDEQRATVQPLVNFLFSNDKVRENPNIYSVPVVFPGNSNSLITFPLVNGDTVLLVYSQKPMQELLVSVGSDLITPRQKGSHEANDAIAIPGFFSFPNALNAANKHTLPHNTNDLIVKHNVGSDNENEVRLKQDGSIHISAGANTKAILNLDGTVSVDAPTSLTVTAPTTTWVGDINQQGTFTSDTEVVAAGVSLVNHTHGGVQTGAGNTGAPN